MSDIMGVCRYCGQVNLNCGLFNNQTAADEFATENCSCREAELARTRRAAIFSAQKKAVELIGSGCEVYGFKPVSEEAFVAISKIIEGCGNGLFVSCAIKIGKTDIKISATEKGDIKIKRKESKEYTLSS